MRKPLIKRIWNTRTGKFYWGVIPAENNWGMGLRPEQRQWNNQAAFYANLLNGVVQ